MSTLEDYRRKARERQARHAERQAQAGQVRITATLPADLLARLDALAAALGITRNAALADAVACWAQPATASRPPGEG